MSTLTHAHTHRLRFSIRLLIRGLDRFLREGVVTGLAASESIERGWGFRHLAPQVCRLLGLVSFEHLLAGLQVDVQ